MFLARGGAGVRQRTSAGCIERYSGFWTMGISEGPSFGVRIEEHGASLVPDLDPRGHLRASYRQISLMTP